MRKNGGEHLKSAKVSNKRARRRDVAARQRPAGKKLSCASAKLRVRPPPWRVNYRALPSAANSSQMAYSIWRNEIGIEINAMPAPHCTASRSIIASFSPAKRSPLMSYHAHQNRCRARACRQTQVASWVSRSISRCRDSRLVALRGSKQSSLLRCSARHQAAALSR